MHKPYQTVHVFSPKSEKHETFFLLFVCPHGFLQYSLLCLFSVACETQFFTQLSQMGKL